MKTNTTEDLIQKGWDIRYSDIQGCLKVAQDLEKLAIKSKDEKAHAWSLLLKAIGSFLLSKEENYLDLLFKSKTWFDHNSENFGFPVCLYFIGNVYESLGDYDQALHYVHEGIKAAEKIGFDEGQSDALSVAGIIYSRIGNQVNAIKNFKECLKIRGNLRNYKAMASTLNLIARSYSLSGDYKNSLHHYKKSLSLRERYNDTGGLPWTYLGMASLMEKFEHVKEAQQQYKKGLEINKNSEDKRYNLHCLIGLGRLAIKSDQLKDAENYLKNAQEIAEALNAKPLLFEIYHAFAELYEIQNKSIDALSFYKKFHVLKEEVLNSDSQKRIHNQQVSFAIEKSQKEAEIYQLKNVELKKAFEEIEEKNKDITDSINYAKRIQQAKLPKLEDIYACLPQSFILFKPKDIVSGDFYFFHNPNIKSHSELVSESSQTGNVNKVRNDELVIIAAADCTGHGVPGAFMSMIGLERLDDAVSQTTDTSEILKQLNKGIKTSLRQSDSEESTRDGMDIALCSFDVKNRILKYAGANRPLWIIRKGQAEIEETKATKKALGGLTDDEQHFDTHTLKLNKGDTVYIFSDGYVDQFNADDKKLMSRLFKEILFSIQDKSMEEQKEFLNTFIENWKVNTEQTDDILVIGIRV